MVSPLKNIFMRCGVLFFASTTLLLLASCGRKSSCPIYWEGAENGSGAGSPAGGGDKTDWKVETNATKPAEDSGETAGSGDKKTTSEFPMVRVKRDKNGIISKKPMSRNKVKRTDPRKEYKGT